MKRTKYLSAAALLIMLAACSNDDMENASYQDDPLAVRITATAGKNVISRSNPTDDTKQSAFNDGDKISISAGDQDAVTYTKKSTGWTPESGYLKWTKPQLTFNAYYPVGVNNASMTTFDVPSDQSSLTVIENADYMTYTGDKNKPASADGTIDIEMGRKMARVVIGEIKFLDQYATGYSVTSITVHGNTSGYKNGSVKTGTADISSYKAEDGKFYALLSPTTAATTSDFLTITVKADNAAETAPGTPLTVKGIPALASSNSYTYTLTVGKDMAAISSVTVKAWTDGGVIGNEGEAEERKPIDVDAKNNTIKLNKAGALTSDAIDEAISKYGALSISGPMNDDDIKTVSSYLKTLDDSKEISLELTGANFKSLSDNAFKDVKSLRWIYLPTTLKTIGNSAFEGCSKLASVDGVENVETIGSKAFKGVFTEDSKNHQITLFLYNATSIGAYAFEGAAIDGNLTLYLLSEEDIDVTDAFKNEDGTTMSERVILFLNETKRGNGEVSDDYKTWKGYTFSSIGHYTPQ